MFLHPFLNLGTRWGYWLTLHLSRFNPENYPASITLEAGWVLGPENLADTGIRSSDRPDRSESLYRPCYHSRLLGNDINSSLCPSFQRKPVNIPIHLKRMGFFFLTERRNVMLGRNVVKNAVKIRGYEDLSLWNVITCRLVICYQRFERSLPLHLHLQCDEGELSFDCWPLNLTSLRPSKHR